MRQNRERQSSNGKRQSISTDGRIFPVSALDHRGKNKSDELDLEEKFFPIQLKQKDKLGRPDVDAFEAMMMREEVQKAFLVSFDLGWKAAR